MSQLSNVLAHITAFLAHLSLPLPQVSVEVLLLAGRAVFLVFSFVLAAVTFSRWRREAQRGSAQLSVQNNLTLDRLAAIEERVASTNYRLAELTAQVDSEPRARPSSEPAVPRYEAAIRLARSGACREELVTKCGLSGQEAELVQRVHGPAQHAKRTQVAA
ncbi:MAG TPA: DUF2802 domain-containing protein [Steroidobacteraceae bacterium]